MTLPISQKTLQKYAAELGPDDGIDPRLLSRPPRPQQGRKAMQLCAQIRETLSWVLGVQTGVPLLAFLEVLTVEPIGNSAQLLITVVTPSDITVDDAMAALRSATRAIRAEVAGAIHRRKVPELFFRVVVQQSP